MNRWFWPTLWAVALVACGLISSQPRSGRQASSSGPASSNACHREAVVAALTKELDQCREEAKAAVEPRTEVPKRTRWAHTQRPPRRCGGESPKIVQVPTSECVKGMVCLDDKGQRALALNLAAYEAWVRRILACENTP